jgi:predicted molibdopterin-dependent oxidoreductase YjgC
MSGAAGADDVAGADGAAGVSSFDFDGRRVTYVDGQTVGAALWADGVRSWRRTRFAGRPRGLFCGIGVCFDCLVEVDGRPDQRACLVPARAGALVRTQEGSGRADQQV